MSRKLSVGTLDECEAGLMRQHEALKKLAIKAVYRSVAMGLWLLKAQEAHRCLTVGQRRGNGKFGEGEHTFDGWLAAKTRHLFQRATAYNCITAAVNVGLTADSTEADVDALEKAGTLDGRKLAGDLYVAQLKGPVEDPTPTPRGDPAFVAQQLWLPFHQALFVAVDETETDTLFHLPLTSDDPIHQVSLEGLETYLEKTLETVRSVKAEKAQGRTRGGKRKAS